MGLRWKEEDTLVKTATLLKTRSDATPRSRHEKRTPRHYKDSSSNVRFSKNGCVTATKSGTTDIIFVAATKNFAAATKRSVDRTKHFVVTKYFCYPYINK